MELHYVVYYEYIVRIIYDRNRSYMVYVIVLNHCNNNMVSIERCVV